MPFSKGNSSGVYFHLIVCLSVCVHVCDIFLYYLYVHAYIHNIIYIDTHKYIYTIIFMLVHVSTMIFWIASLSCILHCHCVDLWSPQLLRSEHFYSFAERVLSFFFLEYPLLLVNLKLTIEEDSTSCLDVWLSPLLIVMSGQSCHSLYFILCQVSRRQTGNQKTRDIIMS